MAALSIPGWADTTLVRDGIPVSVIILQPKATKSAQLGAAELQYHVKLITGAELPVVTTPDPAKVNIFIGGNNEGLKGETSVMRFENGNIFLTGNDSPDFEKVNYAKPETFPPFEFKYNGSLWAVYDFLELCSGVRFYGMTETDTVYTPRKDLTVKEVNRTYTPKLDAFREVYPDDYYSKSKGVKVTPRELALWKLRWRMSCFYGRTNHNMESIFFYYYKRAKTKHLAPVFIESRPQYFAKGYEGLGAGLGDWLLAMNYPADKDVPPQLCYTNPGVSDWYAREVLEYAQGRNVKGGFGNKVGTASTSVTTLPRFEGKPFFYPIEGGDNGSFCKCADCRRLLGEANNASVLKFTLMSEIARKAAMKDPGAGVSTLAYIQSLYYPEGVKLPDNLSVQLCLTVYSWWHPEAYRLQHGEYKKWIRNEAKKRPLTLWTYLFSTYWDTMHYGRYKPFPGFYPWKTAEMFKEFTSDGIQGWFTEVQMQYNTLEAYIAARICYDPSVNTDALIDEYFNLFYGPAGNTMKDFYQEVEKAFWNPENCPKEWLKKPNVLVGPMGKKHPFWGTGLISPEICWQMGSDARMQKLDKLIGEARAQVKDPRQKARLDRFYREVWEVAIAGKKDFNDLQKLPKQNTTVILPRIPDADGDPEKADWSKAYLSDDFTDALGRPVDRKCRIHMAMDSKYFYLKLHEDAAPVPGKMLWRENLEIFFSAGKSYPVYHAGISPFGENAFYIHDMVNDAEVNREYDFKMKIINRPGKNTWDIMLSIPLDRLPFNGNELTANFFRTWEAHGKFSVWSPINVSYYLGGLQRFGTLKKSEKQLQKNKE